MSHEEVVLNDYERPAALARIDELLNQGYVVAFVMPFRTDDRPFASVYLHKLEVTDEYSVGTGASHIARQTKP